jgi:hypothetical protein
LDLNKTYAARKFNVGEMYQKNIINALHSFHCDSDEDFLGFDFADNKSGMSN